MKSRAAVAGDEEEDDIDDLYDLANYDSDEDLEGNAYFYKIYKILCAR